MRLIDADNEILNRKLSFYKYYTGIDEAPYEYASHELDNVPTIPAIPIPEGATNGDVLKRLLYGKAIITEYIHDVNISVNNNVIGQFDMEWWNSPYKRGETE